MGDIWAWIPVSCLAFLPKPVLLRRRPPLTSSDPVVRVCLQFTTSAIQALPACADPISVSFCPQNDAATLLLIPLAFAQAHLMWIAEESYVACPHARTQHGA